MKILIKIIIFLAVDFLVQRFGSQSGPGTYFELQENNLISFKRNLKEVGARKISSNSLGAIDLTDRTIDLDKLKNLDLIMGDSFAEGMVTDYENSFSARLTQELEKRGRQVINFAVSGNTSIHYYLKLKNILAKDEIHPKRIFLFLDLSDLVSYKRYELVEGKVQVIDEGVSLPPWLNRFYQFHLIGKVYDNIKERYKRYELRKDILYLPSNYLREYKIFNEIDPNIEHYLYMGIWSQTKTLMGRSIEKNLEGNLYYLDQFVRLALDNNIELKVIGIPWAFNCLYDLNFSIVEKTMREKIDTNERVQFVWLRDFIPTGLERAEKVEFVKKHYEEDNFHFNTQGHIRFGKLLTEALIQQ